jgi:hypothetical protein
MAPSFGCMLTRKYTIIKLKLLSDYDKLLMMEAGIRGGFMKAVKRYSKANNHKVSGYGPSEKHLWIIYLGGTNLYVLKSLFFTHILKLAFSFLYIIIDGR